MVEKKLLTLAGAVGILACGSCFLPPLPQRNPPPPPVRMGLSGIRSIRVEVANSSPTHHLDPASLAQKIADAINEQSWRTKVSAYAGKEADGGDAVLAITVLSETVEAAPLEKNVRLIFLIHDSARLTKADGIQMWWELAAGNSIQRDVVDENVADVWKEPGLADSVSRGLSKRLVFRLLNGH